jgi:uncharacterized lipoprotein YddW (UPF0748 family)
MVRARESRGRGKALLFSLAPCVVLLLAPAAFARQAGSGPQPSADEVRALWVVRTTLTTPEKIHVMVERAAGAGFNTLVVQVRGRGDAYYRSRWEPRAATLAGQAPDFDPLALTLKEAKRKGLKVHAWLNTNLLANLDEPPDEAAHVYNARPEWLAVPRPVAAELYSVPPADPRFRARVVEWSKANRAELEGVYVGPSQPEVREHIYSIWMDVLERYDVDGLHFDYVRFASPDFDYSRASLTRFRAWLDPHLSAPERRLLDSALKSNPLAAADAYPERFADFQREQVTTLVERIAAGVKKRRPSLTVSAAVFADAENAFGRRFQDWRRWLSMGLLDVVCPMAYTTDPEAFRRQIEVAAAAAKSSGKRLWAGVGAYRLTPEQTVERIKTARSLGADGVILFSYDSMIAPRPEDAAAGESYLTRVRRGAFDAPASGGAGLRP